MDVMYIYREDLHSSTVIVELALIHVVIRLYTTYGWYIFILGGLAALHYKCSLRLVPIVYIFINNYLLIHNVLCMIECYS